MALTQLIAAPRPTGETIRAIFPAIFRTARLTFRPIAPDNARPIFDLYAQDIEVTRFLSWRRHQSLDDTRTYIVHCLATSACVS